MTDHVHESTAPAKKKRVTLWLFIVLIFALFTFVALSVFGPNPPIEISVATTHITKPLAADGYPDYAAVLRADMKQGVTPENNGAIPFLRSMWPEYDEDFTAEDGELLCEELGMKVPLFGNEQVTNFFSKTNRLGALRLLRKVLPRNELTAGEIVKQELSITEEGDSEREAFLIEYYGGTGELDNATFFDGPEEKASEDSRITELLSNCTPIGRPWTEKEIPFLAEWLEENQAAIDRLVEAANKPKWYLPANELIQFDRNNNFFISMLSTQQARESARILMTRSNYYLGRKQYDLAIQDAMSILRIGRHLQQGPTLVDQLVANAVSGIGVEQIIRISMGKNIPSKSLRNMLSELNTLPPSGRMLHTLDQGERFFGLNALITNEGRLMAGDFSDLSIDFESLIHVLTTRTKVDWNFALRKQNSLSDSIVAAAKLPTWNQQQAAFEKIGNQFEASYQKSVAPWSLAWQLVTPSRRGKLLAEYMIRNLNALFGQCFALEARSRTRHSMAKLAVALAIYRAEQGEYPDKIEALVPSILPTLPTDNYQRLPFVYRPIKTNEGEPGYLLYSVGPNGIDDEGSCTEETSYQSGPHSFQGQVIDGWVDFTPEEQLLIEKIPPTADDASLRVPLKMEPWPWEEFVEEFNVP